MFHYMTKITRDAFQGKPFSGERDNDDKRKLNPRRKQRANNTEPAVTRPGKSFPGGRTLRRTMSNLSKRQNAVAKDGKKPGSMKP